MSPASRSIALLVLALSLSACAGQSFPPAANPGASSAVGATEAGPTPQALSAGTHSTANFRPTLTFTVPAGWELVADTPNWVQLRPAGVENLGIYLFRDARAASQDPACPTTPADGVGMTSSELTAFFRGLPGLVAGSPALVSVGGLNGASIDLGLTQGWTLSCPFAGGVPTVPLLMNAGIDRWVLAGGERLRFYFLDLPAGNVVVDVDDFEGSQIDTLIASSTPIIKSFVFADDAGPGASPSAAASPAAGSPAASAAASPVVSPSVSAAP
ncbi:MAG TPA: hypothetical protein VFQ75_01580 [Candidatus Limnocylindrales bacterium]|nr:hypothetical protein [Candidatus Limnocylindrales bacterium]